MNPTDPVKLADDVPRSTADLLSELCRMQSVHLRILRDRLKVAETSNHVLATELLEASEARAAALVSLANQTRRARSIAEKAVKQCAVVVDALRALAQVSQDVCDEEGWTNRDGVFQSRIREANELLKVVDQSAEAAAKGDARPE